MSQMAIHASDGMQGNTRPSWLGMPEDNLHFVVTPPTIDKKTTQWTLSDDGKYALSSGSSVILWDVALAAPLIVYKGTPAPARFSQYSPHLVYLAETDDYWTLRDLCTTEIRGFFKTSELPAKNEAKISDSFLQKVSANQLSMDFSDMDIDPTHSRIVLGGLIPMLWNLQKIRPKWLVQRSVKDWFDPVTKGMWYKSPKYRGIVNEYSNVRCTFANDSLIYLALPTKGIFVFDLDSRCKKHIELDEFVNQLHRHKDYIVAELYLHSPAILKVGEDIPRSLVASNGASLPFRNISNISDQGWFLGVCPGPDQHCLIGKLHSDGTASWDELYNARGSQKSSEARIILSDSAKSFTFLPRHDDRMSIRSLDINDNDWSRSDVNDYHCDFARSYTPYSGAFLNDSTFAVGTVFGECFIGSASQWKVLNQNNIKDPLLNHSGAVIGVESFGDTMFITADSYGTLRIFDSSTYELLMTMMYFPDSGDYIAYTPDNYYKASKGAVDKIFYAKGLDSFTFRQFDLKYNRPDIIMQRLGGDEAEIRILRSAWEKRLKRMGFDQSTVMSAESHAPELVINNRDKLSGSTASGRVMLDITASDSLTTIQSLHVLINDVPVYSQKGIQTAIANRHTETLDVALAEGSNVITVYCINAQGQESLHHQVTIENTHRNPKTLYVAAVGVSEYDDNSHNLQFAASDAKSFVDALTQGNTRFDQVKLCVLENDQFNKESLAQLRSFFNQTKRDDVAILYYAGHGMLDESLEYYLGCSASDFNNPADQSVRYDDFQDVLEQIPSIHRFCFVDACHSGDIDKDDYLAVNVIPMAEYGELRFRTGGKMTVTSKNREIARRYHSMFVDLSHKSGITVVSSSNGDEMSMESESYGGGLFTGVLKNALAGKCDTDSDGVITSAELLDYVTHKVTEISGGKQNPQVKYNDYDKVTVLR